MSELVTIKTFTYPTEVVVIRARLESEGIKCFVKDEITVQVNPFYSNLVGGIKLQVKEVDMPAAVEILKESGLMPDKSDQPSRLYDGLDKATDKIPFLRNVAFENKLFLTAAIIISLIMVISYFLYPHPPH